MKINDSTMKEVLQPFKEDDEQVMYYCYGLTTATFGQAMLFGDIIAAFLSKYYILGFTDKKLIMVRIGMLGKAEETKTIEYKDISNVKISNWFLGLGKKIQIRGRDKLKLKLKINKRVVTIKKQRENLENICDMLKNKFQ